MKNFLCIFIFALTALFSAHAGDSYPAKGVDDVDGKTAEEVTKLISDAKKKCLVIQVSAFQPN